MVKNQGRKLHGREQIALPGSCIQPDLARRHQWRVKARMPEDHGLRHQRRTTQKHVTHGQGCAVRQGPDEVLSRRMSERREFGGAIRNPEYLLAR